MLSHRHGTRILDRADRLWGGYHDECFTATVKLFIHYQPE